MKKNNISVPIKRNLKKLLLKMKLCLFLLLISTATLIANKSYSQSEKVSLNLEKSEKVSLNLKEKNMTMKDLVEEIEKQTDYIFVFYDGAVDLDESINVDLKLKDYSVKNVLDKVFESTNNTYKIDGRQIVIAKKYPTINKNETKLGEKSSQIKKKITGTVTDEKGEPIPGATVIVKGTTIGMVTDLDGKYTLSIPDDAKTLTFSFVGMRTQDIEIGNKTIIDAILVNEYMDVDEVVVVGYGTQKKVNVIGSVSAVKVDENITNRSVSNISTALQGTLPGLAISQNSGMAGKNDVSLIVRGLGTVNDSDPLVVVDGMPDVDINLLNTNDIESVSVLKDASSSAIYGSRAANGVILITTKSGKGQEKTKINFSSSYAIGVPTKSIDFMDDYPRALTLEQVSSLTNTLRSNLLFKDGTIDQWMALGMIDTKSYPNTDWGDLIIRNSTNQNYNISASGSNDKSNFFVSVGVMKEKGLQINNDYTRYNARFNYDYKLHENMNVGVKFSGNWSKYTYAKADGFTDDDPTSTSGFSLHYAVAGILPYDPETGYYGGVMAYNEDPQAYNPYAMYTLSLNHQNRQEANVSGYWDWTPIKGLTARVNYALNYYNQFRYNAGIPTRAYNFQTNSFGSREYIASNAGIGNYTNTGYKTQLTSQLNYNTVIAKNHNLSAMVVYSEEYWYDRYQMSSRNDRIYESLHEIDAALTDTQSTGGNSGTEGLQSFIGRINYSAYDKYLVEASLRADGSSKFLEGSRFGFFPSAALGWRFTEEKFIKSFTQSWLDNGKLRVSYGGLGNNSGVGQYEQQETLDQSNYYTTGIQKGFAYQKMVNQNLSWETTYVFNLGVDLGFLKNRLTVGIDYYNRLTTDMNRPSDMSILLTGAYDAPRTNIGDLRNRGIEGNVTWKNKKGKLNYSINANISYNATTLEKWNEYLSKGYTFLDMPYHFVYTYEAIGIAQTWADVYNATPQNASPGDVLLKDLNGDGQITSEDKKAYSSFQRDQPKTNFALSLRAEYKGFDMSLLLQGAAGRKDFWLNVYNNTNFPDQRYASTWQHWNDSWTVENRNAELPRLGGSSLNRYESSFWLDDMSYLRVKNFQLGYTLPEHWLKKLGIQTFRIYGSGENLATFTKYRGLDPEKSSNANDVYPLVKSFSLGINVGF